MLVAESLLVSMASWTSARVCCVKGLATDGGVSLHAAATRHAAAKRVVRISNEEEHAGRRRGRRYGLGLFMVDTVGYDPSTSFQPFNSSGTLPLLSAPRSLVILVESNEVRHGHSYRDRLLWRCAHSKDRRRFISISLIHNLMSRKCLFLNSISRFGTDVIETYGGTTSQNFKRHSFHSLSPAMREVVDCRAPSKILATVIFFPTSLYSDHDEYRPTQRLLEEGRSRRLVGERSRCRMLCAVQVCPSSSICW